MQPFDADVDDTYEQAVGDDDLDTGHHRRRSRRSRRNSARVRRSRWRMVLIGGAAVLVVYYGLVFSGMSRGKSDAVLLEAHGLALPADRVDFEVDATNVDPSGGAFDMRLRPVPHGDLEGEAAGQLAVPLQVQVSGPGQPP